MFKSIQIKDFTSVIDISIGIGGLGLIVLKTQ